MKVLIVGAHGTIGTAVAEELEDDATVVKASRNSSEVKVDMTSIESIKNMFKQVGEVDALICTAGAAHFGYVPDMTPEDNQVAVESKLLGQINLVLLGMDYVKDNGSITLVTGILMDDPILKGASSAMANGGVRAFVKSAAMEMPRNIRINSVSPTMLEEAKEKYGPLFQGYEPVKGKSVALAFRKSVFGGQTGQSYNVY